MSEGVIPPILYCNYCRHAVYGSDAQFYEGMHFHDHCLQAYLTKEEAGYDKKARLGRITLAESMELADLREMGKKVREEPAHPAIEGAFFPEMAKFKGNSFLSSQSIRLKSVRAAEEMKALGMNRKQYVALMRQREEELDKKRALNEPKPLPLQAAGVISTCKNCGKRTFCIDDLCNECQNGSKKNGVDAKIRDVNFMEVEES